VYASTSNILARNEIGRVPISLLITIQILKYWIHIISLNEDRILYQAYKSKKDLDEKGHTSWVTFVRELLYRLKLKEIWETQYVCSASDLLQKVKHHLFTKYEEVCQHIHTPIAELSDGMLKVPVELYTKFNIPVKYRKSLTRIRLRSNRLEIVRGKYSKVPVGERVCKQCNQNNAFEDESHFLLFCGKHSKSREKMFQEIALLLPLFVQMTQKEKMYTMLVPPNAQIALAVGRFAYDCLP